MSKKYSRQQKKPAARQLPWPWIILAGALLLLIIGGGLLVWRPSARVEPAAAPELSGAPKLKIDQPVIDEGEVRIETPVRTTFRLSNVGDQPLSILGEPQVELIEGCWPPRAVVSSTTIKPGQEVYLTMDYTMHAGMDGPHEFHVHVQTNDPAEPKQTLIAKSNWVP